LFCVLMTSFLFFDGPRSASEIDFVSQTKRRPDSRPTKHQKEERVRRGGVDTQQRTPRRKVQSLLYACCSGVGVARPQSATSHTLAADTFNVSGTLFALSLLAFLWSAKKSLLLCVSAEKEGFCSGQKKNHRHSPGRFCTMLMVALCGVGLASVVWVFPWPLAKVFFSLRNAVSFSRRTQKCGEERARRDLVTGSACTK